jgi:hypothetical protein
LFGEEYIMIKNHIAKKITAGIFTIIVIALILTVLLPPATAVHVSAGTPNKSSLTTGSTITFEDVSLTIRGDEILPVENLTFTIYNNNGDTEVAYVTFYINGTKIIDQPSGKFSVVNTTVISSNWHGYGYGYAYDEEENEGYNFGYGYGYGYGDGSYDITFLYDITYTTHTTGTFYAKLAVNCSTHEYVSAESETESETFTVSSSTSPGTPGPTNIPPNANAGGPYTAYVGFSITLSGAASNDPDGDITGYRWDFNNDGTYNTDWSSSPTASHTYSQEGTYRAKLQVRDNQGETAIDIATVTVLPQTVHTPSNDTLSYLLEQYGIELTESFQATDTTGDGIVDTFTDPNNLVYLIRKATVEGEVVFLLSTQEGDMPRFFWNSDTDEVTPITSTETETSEPSVNTALKEITIEITVEKADWIYIKIIDNYPPEDYADFTITVTTSDGRVISPEFIWRENGYIYVLDDPDTQYYFIYNYDILPDDLKPTTPDTPTEGIPLWIFAIGIIAVIIIIIVALFKTGYIYVEKEETKKSDEKKKSDTKKK